MGISGTLSLERHAAAELFKCHFNANDTSWTKWENQFDILVNWAFKAAVSLTAGFFYSCCSRVKGVGSNSLSMTGVSHSSGLKQTRFCHGMCIHTDLCRHFCIQTHTLTLTHTSKLCQALCCFALLKESVSNHLTPPCLQICDLLNKHSCDPEKLLDLPNDLSSGEDTWITQWYSIQWQ